MMYVRKKGEKSHGRLIEISYPEKGKIENAVLVFVDDFIDTGCTCDRVLRLARCEVGERGWKAPQHFITVTNKGVSE